MKISELLKEKGIEKKEGKNYKRFQVELSKIIKDYGIVAPGTLRLWKKAKTDYGWIEAQVKSLEESIKGKNKKEYAGVLMSKIFPKKAK